MFPSTFLLFVLEPENKIEYFVQKLLFKVWKVQV